MKSSVPGEPSKQPDVGRQIELVLADGYIKNAMTGRTGRRFKTSHTSIPPAAGEYLSNQIARLQARRCLEVGLGLGVSALHMLRGLDKLDLASSFCTVDAYQTALWDDAGVATLERAGVRQMVQFIPLDSAIALAMLRQLGFEFDFAFVDGGHHFEVVLRDAVAASAIMAEGGLIVLDDVFLPSVTCAVNYLTTNMGWRIADRPEYTRDDLGRPRLIALEPARFDRGWDDFHPFPT